MVRKLCAMLGATLAVLFAGQAAAAAELFSKDTFSGLVDLRAAAASGEASWLDGGFGKLRFGGQNNQLDGHLALADAALVWRPRFTWDLGAVIDGEVQRGDSYNADLIQAYLTYKPVPRGDTRYSARVGLFYPPISLEHGGPEWSVTDSITPSAINTWVGEEVKVVGGEGSISHTFGGHQLTATGAVFGFNDTSGTLLTFRGWAMHDLKAGADFGYALPPLEQKYLIGQPRETYPLREIDSRVGYYGRVEWRPPGPLTLSAFYYNNQGNLVGVDADHQWAWATRFWNFGGTLKLNEETRLLSQVMTGETLMGFPKNGHPEWFNVGFTSAYVLISHDHDRSGVTGRVEYFETRDRNFRPATDDTDADWGEKGWAITGGYHFALTPHARLFLEALHTRSNRPSRMEAGIPAKQRQTQVQTSLRLSF